MTNPTVAYRSAREPEADADRSTRAWERYGRACRAHAALATVVFSVVAVLAVLSLPHAMAALACSLLPLYVARSRVRLCRCPECKEPIAGDASSRRPFAEWFGVFPSQCSHCGAEVLTAPELEARRCESEGRKPPLCHRVSRRVPGFALVVVATLVVASLVEFDRSGPEITIEDHSIPAAPIGVSVSLGQLSGLPYVHGVKGLGLTPPVRGGSNSNPPASASSDNWGEQTMRATSMPF